MWQCLDRNKTGLVIASLLGVALVMPVTGLAERQPSDYGTCLTLVDRNPEDAHAYAMEWLDFGGGVPARHCAALALIDLNHEIKAAEQLEDMALNQGGLGEVLRVELLSQAGNARLLVRDGDGALQAFHQALQLAEPIGRSELMSQLLIDRARAYGLQNKYQSASDDLDRALGLSPSSTSALTLRGAARRQLGQLEPALKDLNQALIISPYYAAALLERGTVHALLGNRPEAREDWLEAAQRGGGTDIAEQARRNIEKMDQDSAAHSSKTDGSDSPSE